MQLRWFGFSSKGRGPAAPASAGVLCVQPNVDSSSVFNRCALLEERGFPFSLALQMSLSCQPLLLPSLSSVARCSAVFKGVNAQGTAKGVEFVALLNVERFLILGE